MSGIKVVNLDRDTKRLLYLGLGVLTVILGAIIIFDYLIIFFRLLVGVLLILLGFGLIFKSQKPFGRLFFRF